MKQIKAKRLDIADHKDRPLAKDIDGNFYVDINCAAWFLVDGKTSLPEYWHTVTKDGEPDYPVNLVFDKSNEI
jgi:hypothetical protein